MNRRQALKATAVITAAAAAVPQIIAQGFSDLQSKALAGGAYPFQLPLLPYALDELEPHIGARSLKIHHGDNNVVANQWHFAGRRAKEVPHGYHAARVTNLNKALSQDTNYFLSQAHIHRIGKNGRNATDQWLEAMLKDLSSVPEQIRTAIRNEGGGHYNHTLFWQMMKKQGGGEPKNELAQAIAKHSGSFNAFKASFTEAATKHFGSGWVWLTLNGKELRIETTSDEDTPLSSGREVLLGLDLWEHAYYQQYQNERADYIAAWWKVVNWDFVAERFAKFRK